MGALKDAARILSEEAAEALVPLDELEGRNTAASHRALVQSVADGGMNILRYAVLSVYTFLTVVSALLAS